MCYTSNDLDSPVLRATFAEADVFVPVTIASIIPWASLGRWTVRVGFCLAAVSGAQALSDLNIDWTQMPAEESGDILVGSSADTIVLRMDSAVSRRVQTERLTAHLARRTRNRHVAARVARAIMHESARRRVHPAMVAGIALIEDETLNPTARSHVGARGIMQVMPLWKGKWGCGSSDLDNVEVNICHGVGVFAMNVGESHDMHTALKRYNGCVRGSNTPDCAQYPKKVLREAQRAAIAMRMPLSN